MNPYQSPREQVDAESTWGLMLAVLAACLMMFGIGAFGCFMAYENYVYPLPPGVPMPISGWLAIGCWVMMAVVAFASPFYIFQIGSQSHE